MGVLDAVGRSLDEAFFMFWATLWALILGFTMSGAVMSWNVRQSARMEPTPSVQRSGGLKPRFQEMRSAAWLEKVKA